MAKKIQQPKEDGRVVVSFNCDQFLIDRVRAIAPDLGFGIGESIEDSLREWCTSREEMAAKIRSVREREMRLNKSAAAKRAWARRKRA